MAQIPKGILGAFKGVIKDMHGVLEKGIPSIVLREFDKKYDFTPGQQLAHDKFGIISHFAKSIRFSVIELFWLPYKKSVSKFQSFMHYNAAFVQDNLVIDYCNLQVVRSVVTTPENQQWGIDGQFGLMQFRFFRPDLTSFGYGNSNMYILLINLDTHESHFLFSLNILQGRTILLSFPPAQPSSGWIFYLWFSGISSRKVSKSRLFIFSKGFTCP